MRRTAACPQKRATPTARLLAALVCVVMAVTGCSFEGVYSLPLPGGADVGDNPYRVKVEFTDVLDLVPRSAVKVGDVDVGRVTKVELDGWHAEVTVEVRGDVRLPDNATAAVQQTSLLGEKFVQLNRPTREQAAGRLGDGDVIPLTRTRRSAEVEEVLSALALLLNGGGLPQLRTINKELNAALSGREDKIKSVISQLDTFVGSLDRQKRSIDRAIRNINKLARQVKKQEPAINRALDRVPPALKILSDQRKNLVRLLEQLSKLGKVGTRVINASRDDLIANLKSLRPILTKLAEAGSDLPNAIGMMLTYPFPSAAADGAIGDYQNLHLTADINLAQILKVVSAGGPSSGRVPDLDQLGKLLEQDTGSRRGPTPEGLLPSGLVPTPTDSGKKGGEPSTPEPTPSSTRSPGDSGNGSGDDDGLLGLLLGGVR